MQRFLSATALVLLASAAVVTTATPAPTRAAHDGKSLTLRLVMRDVGFNFLDNPPRQGFNAPPLIGDQFTFTADLPPARAGARGPSAPPARSRGAASIP